jgi:cytochrome b pre-mRNA-processing protein 3
MILQLFRRSPHATIASLYGMIVAQARATEFYQSYGVPDTVNGRFEMVVLHTVLLLHRLNAGPDGLRSLGQGLFDRFCGDMDANLREMGVGDLAVPREMRKMGEAFYGRQRVYEAALASSDDVALAAALARNVYATAGEPPPAASRLAAYARQAVRHLAEQPGVALTKGEAGFPDPAKVHDDTIPR